MSEPETIRVFVNGRGISVARASQVIDAVRAFDSAAADEVTAGTRAITDSRGHPVALNSAVSGGSVLRLVSARALRDEGASE